MTLFKQHGSLADKQRVYRIKAFGNERFVVTNSPGNAALAVCEVERVPDKELVKAAFAALTAK